MNTNETMNYCDFFKHDELDQTYHDAEWGWPLHDDRQMFEHLAMEVMQCGLSWITCLKRREVFRLCFDNFDIARVAAYTDQDVQRIMQTPGMIRAERKIRAIINNARVASQLPQGLSEWLWQFTDGKVIVYDGHPDGQIPAQNGLSRRVAASLRELGMTFVGPVNTYAHLQASGIINDHSRHCPIYQRIIATHEVAYLPRDHEQ